MEKNATIRNSTVDFLVFTKQNNEDSIEVRVQDEDVWLTQGAISQLFDKGRTTITEHLKNIFDEGELDENSVCREFRHTATDGKDYLTKHYSLDAIISVGYRVNSKRATQFIFGFFFMATPVFVIQLVLLICGKDKQNSN